MMKKPRQYPTKAEVNAAWDAYATACMARISDNTDETVAECERTYRVAVELERRWLQGKRESGKDE